MEDSVSFKLESEYLIPVIQASVGASVTSVTDSRIVALKPGVGNPTSLGVYRVSGTAIVDGTDKPFSVVVKHLADGQPIMDASQPTSWNYYKREIDFFESPLAALIPASLVFPKYLGSTTLPDSSVLFWNEDLGNLGEIHWSWSDCVDATRIVAHLNSIEVSEAYDWFNIGQHQWWADIKRTLLLDMDDQIVELAGGTEAYRLYSPYMERLQDLVDVVRGGRQVFSHGDFNLNNLVPANSHRPLLTALDWQLCGVCGVGTEIAPVLNTAHELGVANGSLEEFEELCRVYLAEFNSINIEPITLDEVRLNAAAMGYLILHIVGYWLGQPLETRTDEENREVLQAILDDSWAKTLTTYSRVLAEYI